MARASGSNTTEAGVGRSPSFRTTADKVDGQSPRSRGPSSRDLVERKVAFMTDGDLAERLAGIAALADPIRRDLYL